MKSLTLILCISLIALSCTKSVESSTAPIELSLAQVPLGFPSVDHPKDNDFTLDRWTLGKRLFYEPLLSRDSSLSCGSCHNPSIAFSDDKALSKGAGGLFGTRNSPTLTNVAYNPYYTREGGVPTLEMQVLVPIQEHNEFDFNIIEISKRLADHTDYQKQSQAAYGKDLDHFVITRAIACFERSLISGNSNYDKFELQNDRQALNSEELEGKALFFSDKTNCSQCHSGFNFTNYAFENNGLYENYEDPGRFRLTKLDEDKHLFKVPTLRNVEVTAPYMHDGSLETLEDVIEHYNTGGRAHSQKSKLIQPLELSEKEKEALIAFLKSLTDHEFINNTIYHENF